MPLTLYAATTNPGKLRDFAQAARASDVEVIALPGLAAMPTPAEDAPTFAGNADHKALAYSQLAPGKLVLADDSGLETLALGGDPGVRSARFADDTGFEPNSPKSKDQRNNDCLLSMLHDLQTASGGRLTRGARFVCALSLARDGQILLRAEGTVEGDLLHAPRGTGGFGYDALFAVRSRGLTLAELPPEDKWSLSHRGHAFRNLLQQLNAAAITI